MLPELDRLSLKAEAFVNHDLTSGRGPPSSSCCVVAGNLSSQVYRHSQLSWMIGHEFFAEYCGTLCSAVGPDTWQMVDGNRTEAP